MAYTSRSDEAIAEIEEEIKASKKKQLIVESDESEDKEEK